MILEFERLSFRVRLEIVFKRDWTPLEVENFLNTGDVIMSMTLLLFHIEQEAILNKKFSLCYDLNWDNKLLRTIKLKLLLQDWILGWAKNGLRAKSGPLRCFIRPAEKIFYYNYNMFNATE